jgi:hypothetical protein
MIGKFCVAAALLFAGTAAAQTSTTINVPIVVTHGAPLTTFTFVNNTGTILPAGSPVSFGQAFRYGDIMPGTYPLIRDASTHVALPGQQWDEISTWRENGGNGSWRHAVWAIQLPNSLAPGATYQVEFVTTAGAYSESSVLPLSALCSGSNSHDLEIHLTDIRNQDDTVRKTGEATFRLCDHITPTGGRDDPRILDQGSVRTTAKIIGKFVYTDASEDPLLYAECDVGLYVDPTTGNSLKDTSWVCWIHNSWMTVAAGTAGHAGAPGPAGLPNDPQVISYRPEVLDGSTSVLNWNSLDATVASASNPVQTTGCGNDYNGNPITNCLNIPGSTGTNALYFGQGVRITSTGTPVGGLPNGGFRWVLNNGSINNNCGSTNIVSIEDMPSPFNANQILTSSQGTGSTTFAFRVWHTTRMSWAMMDPSLDDNWSPGGSATRVTREVLPALATAEKRYWEESGIITPLDVVDQNPNIALPCSFGGDLNYHPFGRANVIGGQQGGPRPDLGFPNDYAAQAFARGNPNDWLLAKLFSISEAAYPYATLLDEATGRIPVLNNGPPTGPGGNGVGGNYPQLGTPRTTYQQYNPPTDFAPPLENVPTAGTNWEAGIWPNLTYGAMDHQPSFQGFTYAILGSRHYLDLLYLQGNRGYSNQYTGPGQGLRDDNLGGTADHYWGLFLICCQGRGSARGLWDKTLPAALGGDNNVERTYYNDIITENGNYYPNWLVWKDGPGNSNLATSIIPPDWIGGGFETDTFVTNYLFATSYVMQTYLHAPLATQWLPVLQRFYEGCLGEQMAGHPVSYYCLDYSYSPATHNADQAIDGQNIGQWLNGTDASDFGGFSEYTRILTGGQMQQQGGSYTLTNGDTVKFANGVAVSPSFPLDQMPGDQWFSILQVDNSNQTFYVQCPLTHPVDATCPTPGAAFTGFTRSGVPVIENGDAIFYRPQFDPGPGGGFADVNYAPYGKMILNGLQVLGYDVSHAQSIADTRWGNNSWNYEPYQWWDPTILVPQ